MIVVTIELRSAVSGEGEVIGTMMLGNEGVRGTKADYSVHVGRRSTAARYAKELHPFKPTTVELFMKGAMRTGRVTNYPRDSYNVWRLVCRALRAAFPEES